MNEIYNFCIDSVYHNDEDYFWWFIPLNIGLASQTWKQPLPVNCPSDTSIKYNGRPAANRKKRKGIRKAPTNIEQKGDQEASYKYKTGRGSRGLQNRKRIRKAPTIIKQKGDQEVSYKYKTGSRGLQNKKRIRKVFTNTQREGDQEGL